MTKIQLSADEMKLVQNSQWILTKHRIIEKVYALFGDVSLQMQAFLQQSAHALPPEATQLPPKISKGEQYERLPYVVLDYPRLFSKEAVCAVRCFFWWGHYFSLTLHLKGIHQHRWHRHIAAAITAKDLKDVYVSLAGDEFSFNLQGKNYRFFDGATAYPKQAAAEAPFLKISFLIPFEAWDTAAQQLVQVFQSVMNVLTIDQLPMR